MFGVMIVLARTPNDFDLCRYILGFDVAEVQVHNQRGQFSALPTAAPRICLGFGGCVAQSRELGVLLFFFSHTHNNTWVSGLEA